MMKYHSWRGKRTPIQLSAPNVRANVCSCSISSEGKYFFVSPMTLHSMAKRRMALPARRSGAG